VKNKKKVIIVLGEPNSVFIEILSKVLSKNIYKKKIKYPLILIGSKNLLISQLKLLKKKINFEELKIKNFQSKRLQNKTYLIDINYKFKHPFEKISYKSKKYISGCFKIAFKYLNSRKANIVINGPVSKEHFLSKLYPGVTEYVFKNTKKKISKKPVMLIYNKKLSVSPLTTHIALKDVSKQINQKLIINNVLAINDFYKKKLNIIPNIALMGLNPHCESKSKFNEEKRIIKPAIIKLKKRKISISGPFSADTFFLKENIKNYQSIVGMYHDQVLTPFKTIFNFDASNITLGLPFMRLSVDHGPNERMLGKNKSNTKSLENIFDFIHSLK
tara:strand:- start:51 stop:1040 length:990 start_codon:yes stop_codon:yes gene_type:complete